MYRVLIDYGPYENYIFEKGEFSTIDEAVKQATSNSLGNEFLIVKVIDWKATDNENN